MRTVSVKVSLYLQILVYKQHNRGAFSTLWYLLLYLRCLRLVTQCWHSFTDDSIYEAKIEKLNFKRQKTFNDANSSSGSSIEGPKLGSACHKKSKNKHKLFLNAKACLLSLKRTLEDLHRKGLFPYNPKPLLKRFVVMVICLLCFSVKL